MNRSVFPTPILVVLMILIGTPSSDCSAQDNDRKQSRLAGVRIEVPVDRIEIDDGDTITIDWGEGESETVRILGIDTPETQHVPHNIPYDQSFGRIAEGFAKGAFAVATKVELLRAPMIDPYGRTLGYLFINDQNYSVLILRAGLAVETVSHYGDNGLPEEAAACMEAAKDQGPVPFEPPYLYRKRMREVSEWMREQRRLLKQED